MIESNCEILFKDENGDEYGCRLDINRVDMMLHALNNMRSDYCVHSKEFKCISSVFDFLLFVYEDLENRIDDNEDGFED